MPASETRNLPWQSSGPEGSRGSLAQRASSTRQENQGATRWCPFYFLLLPRFGSGLRCSVPLAGVEGPRGEGLRGAAVEIRDWGDGTAGSLPRLSSTSDGSLRRSRLGSRLREVERSPERPRSRSRSRSADRPRPSTVAALAGPKPP